jgi:aminoglycoside 6'-N-acetyltransferase I
VTIRQASIADQLELASMRHLLWPDSSTEEHRIEVANVLDSGMYGTQPMAVFLSLDDEAGPTGFIEVGLRSHADGCDHAHPVGFIEGWFVREAHREQGTGRALMRFAEEWARSQGCLEIASDTWIDHEDSQRAHQAMGFEVVDRCVHFRKSL